MHNNFWENVEEEQFNFLMSICALRGSTFDFETKIYIDGEYNILCNLSNGINEQSIIEMLMCLGKERANRERAQGLK